MHKKVRTIVFCPERTFKWKIQIGMKQTDGKRNTLERAQKSQSGYTSVRINIKTKQITKDKVEEFR